MTQYATSEEKFQCIRCAIWCTERELVYLYKPELDRETAHCPNCGRYSTYFTSEAYDTVCNT